MTMRILVVLAVVAGCAADPRTDQPADWAPPHAPWTDPAPEPPAPPRFTDPKAAHYHMRQHFDDLRMIEQLLLAGKLDEGTTLASLIGQRYDDPGMADWQEHGARVNAAAIALTKATQLDDALRLEARVAVECAGCHLAAQSRVSFGSVPSLPPDRQTPATRMARHAWAVDRLWEGLIASDDARWARGLAVLSDTPLPFSSATTAPRYARELRALARAQVDTRTTTNFDDRGVAYGEMLVRCAGCHSSLRVTSR